MDTTPQVDEDLVAKSLAELADEAYQTQVWTGRVPTVRSSFLECVTSLFGDSGLSAALDAGPVFTPDIDRHLLRLRELLAEVKELQPIGSLLRDAELGRVRLLAAGILGELGVTAVAKRGLAELDLPHELPPWPLWARLALAGAVLLAVLVVAAIVFQPRVSCDPVDDNGTVSAYQCR